MGTPWAPGACPTPDRVRRAERAVVAARRGGLGSRLRSKVSATALGPEAAALGAGGETRLAGQSGRSSRWGRRVPGEVGGLLEALHPVPLPPALGDRSAPESAP